MGKLKGINKSTKIAILVFFLVIIGAMSFRMAVSEGVAPFDPDNKGKVTVTIPMGSATGQIALILEENGIIGDADAFKIVSKVTGSDGKYKAGTYGLSPSMSAYEIIKIIHSGISVGNIVTIPEGYSINQVADALAKKGLVDKTEFLNQVQSGEFEQKFIEALPKNADRLEGFLFPETYDMPIDASVHDIINIMLNQFTKVYTSEYETRAKEMGFTMREIITIASMIEREAATNEDRPLVASVIYNRLSQEMALQFCSTVQYILGDSKARLSYEDTQIESEYNTYINAGLPPGPICSPGAEAIKAALYPAETAYLYFVVDPNGERTHKFATTYEEFLNYKKEYTDSL